MAEPYPLSPALWAATAPPAPPTPPLTETTSADAVVIGGGYAGLSTALHLAERGVSAVVLEQHEPGWGGSGRNGGQAIPGLKHDPDELETMFGPERGRRLADFAGRTVDVVFDLVERHRMDVPRTRKGWIQAAHTPAGVALTRRRAEQWQRRGLAGARILDKADADRLIGTDRYLGGWLDPRGGAIQPLSFVRGLAKAALAAGARVHGRSPVVRLAREGGKWFAETKSGARVIADNVIVCTNGYAGSLLPALPTTIIAPNSYQIATAPLSANVARSILPEGQVSSDTRQLLFYFRLDHENRLLIGGRGPFREPTSAADWSHLERALVKMFPQVDGVPIAYRWCGRVAITRDFLPHLHEPAPGMLVDIGCMGRGVGLQTAMGQAMAEYVATGNRNALPLPPVPVKALPLHGLHRAWLSAIIAWYRMQDGGLA